MRSSKKDMIDYSNIEDFILYSFDNTWVSSVFCENCGVIFYIEIPFNVYKVKKEYSNIDLFFCEKCYKEIQKRHADFGIKWEGEQYWCAVSSSPDLQ